VPQRQVNIRLDDAEFERLEAAAFVHRRSLPEELRVAVKAWLAALEGDPAIATVESARDPLPNSETDDEASVHLLDAKRRGGRGKKT
jgi:hypothetical protein